MNFPRTAKEARSLGVLFYLTGKPCCAGHIGLRYASIHQCVECSKHKAVKRRAANPEAYRAACKRWRDKAPEVDRERCRETYWKNPERAKARKAEWSALNPEKRSQQERNRRARKMAAEGFHTIEDVRRIRAAQRDRCACCRLPLRKKGHLDHIVPLSRGGTNWPQNLQWLCASCNLAKGAKDPTLFMQERGFLV